MVVRAWISEQPVSELRFRYKSERRRRSDDEEPDTGRQAAGIPGIFSSQAKKTYPSITIEGYEGWATIRVSCVSDEKIDESYRPHPHELVGVNCKNGYFFEEWFKITTHLHVKPFDKMSIRCVRKRDIKTALERRVRHKVDPFGTGIDHAKEPNNINLGAIRLCFEVFIHDGNDGLKVFRLVSDVIRDTKKLSKLNISYLSHTSAPVTGTENNIVLLCDKILTREIKVVFFEEDAQDRKRLWESVVTSDFIYQHVAVAVKVPPYRNPQSTRDHSVLMELWDSSDNSRSEPYTFVYTPIYTAPAYLKKPPPSTTSHGIKVDPTLKPKQELTSMSIETKFGKYTISTRNKPLAAIPAELYEPTTFQFSTTSVPTTTFQQPSTATGLKYVYLEPRKSTTVMERLHSLPGPSTETPHFQRGSSCPDSDSSNQDYPISSLDFKDPNIWTDNAVDAMLRQASLCLDLSQVSHFGSKINCDQGMAFNMVDPHAVQKEEVMDTFDSTSIGHFGNPSSNVGDCSSQSVLPTATKKSPFTPQSEDDDRLQSIDEFISQMNRPRSRNENDMSQDIGSLELMDSPNYPVFEDLLK